LNERGSDLWFVDSLWVRGLAAVAGPRASDSGVTSTDNRLFPRPSSGGVSDGSPLARLAARVWQLEQPVPAGSVAGPRRALFESIFKRHEWFDPDLEYPFIDGGTIVQVHQKGVWRKRGAQSHATRTFCVAG